MIWLFIGIALAVVLFGFVVILGSPYVPSQRKDIKQALTELYPLSRGDLLLDIGSGDGVVLRAAAKIGARAVGYEINPVLVLISRILSRNNKKITTRLADFWMAKFPDETTVIYIFSVTRDMKKIIEKIQIETNRLHRPLNVISYGSGFGEKKTIKDIGACHLYIFYPST